MSLNLLIGCLSESYREYSAEGVLIVTSARVPRGISPTLVTPGGLGAYVGVQELLVPRRQGRFFALSCAEKFRLRGGVFCAGKFKSVAVNSGMQSLMTLASRTLSVDVARGGSVVSAGVVESTLRERA